MRQIALSVAFITLIGLLVGMLFILVQINRQGLTINIKGQVKLADATTGVMGKVSLVMEEPVNLIATGPDKEAIPANLSVAPCPQCGGSMVPVRWYPLSGEIEWRCLECGYTSEAPETP